MSKKLFGIPKRTEDGHLLVNEEELVTKHDTPSKVAVLPASDPVVTKSPLELKELLIMICDFLSIRDILALEQTCKRTRALLKRQNFGWFRASEALDRNELAHRINMWRKKSVLGVTQIGFISADAKRVEAIVRTYTTAVITVETKDECSLIQMDLQTKEFFTTEYGPYHAFFNRNCILLFSMATHRLEKFLTYTSWDEIGKLQNTSTEISGLIFSRIEVIDKGLYASTADGEIVTFDVCVGGSLVHTVETRLDEDDVPASFKMSTHIGFTVYNKKKGCIVYKTFVPPYFEADYKGLAFKSHNELTMAEPLSRGQVIKAGQTIIMVKQVVTIGKGGEAYDQENLVFFDKKGKRLATFNMKGVWDMMPNNIHEMPNNKWVFALGTSDKALNYLVIADIFQKKFFTARINARHSVKSIRWWNLVFFATDLEAFIVFTNRPRLMRNIFRETVQQNRVYKRKLKLEPKELLYDELSNSVYYVDSEGIKLLTLEEEPSVAQLKSSMIIKEKVNPAYTKKSPLVTSESDLMGEEKEPVPKTIKTVMTAEEKETWLSHMQKRKEEGETKAEPDLKRLHLGPG